MGFPLYTLYSLFSCKQMPFLSHVKWISVVAIVVLALFCIPSAHHHEWQGDALLNYRHFCYNIGELVLKIKLFPCFEPSFIN